MRYASILGGKVLSTFEVPITTEGKVPLAITGALSGRRLVTAQPAEGADIFRSIAIAARRFAVSLDAAVAQMRLADTNVVFPFREGRRTNTYDLEPLLQAFESCVFRAAELFEAFGSDVIKALPALKDKRYKELKAEYIQTVSARRRSWTLICNKIKHNQNVLSSRAVLYLASGKIVVGYALMEPHGKDALFVNSALHKKPERARSFNLSLRQLLFDILKCDRAAAALVGQLPDDADEALPSVQTEWSVGDAARYLASRPLWTVPNEKSMFDGFTVASDRLITARMHGERVAERYTATAALQGDGVTTIFEAML